MRDEAVRCVLIVCVGPRDSMIGCVLHVNARGSLGVYIWRRSARQRECGRAVRECMCGARRVYWSCSSWS